MKPLAALALVIALPVSAHNLSQRECIRFAGDMYAVAAEKLDGHTMESEIKDADQDIPKCMQSDSCLYKDQEDLARVYYAIRAIYKTNMPPDAVAQFITKEVCNATAN